MKMTKKFGLVLLMIALVASFGFSANWNPTASDNQVINLEGNIQGVDVTCMTLQASNTVDGTFLPQSLLDLTLTGTGGSAYFNLINATLYPTEPTNVATDTKYSCTISVTPFEVLDSMGLEGYDKETVTLKTWTPQSIDSTYSATEHFTVSTVGTFVADSTSAAVNITYQPGQTRNFAEFLTFSVGWDGSDTLITGDYISTVTAVFAKL